MVLGSTTDRIITHVFLVMVHYTESRVFARRDVVVVSAREEMCVDERRFDFALFAR
jgi:hypothetical protein